MFDNNYDLSNIREELHNCQREFVFMELDSIQHSICAAGHNFGWNLSQTHFLHS